MTNATPKTLIAATALAALVAAGCGGDKAENKDLPAKPEALAKTETQADKDNQAKWEKLAAELQIGANKSQAELAVPSKNVTENASAYVNTMAGLHVAHGAYKSRCAGIDAVTKIKPMRPDGSEAEGAYAADFKTPVDASVYKITYRLQKDAAGAPDDAARTGLLVVPNGTDKSPLVVYAHDGDRGLAYNEIAVAFGDLQAKHVIAAPTYPGEPLCKTAPGELATCDSHGVDTALTGAQDPFNTDVDEVLGLQDCVARAMVDAYASTLGVPDAGLEAKNYAGQKIGTALVDGTTKAKDFFGAKVKGVGGADVGFLPQTIIFGNGRGALVGELAVARSGAQLLTSKANAAALGEKFFTTVTGNANTTVTVPTLASCNVGQSGLLGFTAGQPRLMLEALVKGKTTLNGVLDFAAVPGVAGFKTNALASLKDASDESIKATARAIELRDATFNAVLYQIGLRNASKVKASPTGTPDPTKFGAALYLHGLEDKVNAWTNTQLLHNVTLGVFGKAYADAARQFPGAKPKTRIVKAPDALKNADGTFKEDPLTKKPYRAHFDAAYFGAKSAIIPNFVATEALKPLDDFADAAKNTAQTPAEVLSAWLDAECKAALTP